MSRPFSYLKTGIKLGNCVHCLISPDLFTSLHVFCTETISSDQGSIHIPDIFNTLYCQEHVGTSTSNLN